MSVGCMGSLVCLVSCVMMFVSMGVLVGLRVCFLKWCMIVLIERFGLWVNMNMVMISVMMMLIGLVRVKFSVRSKIFIVFRRMRFWC